MMKIEEKDMVIAKMTSQQSTVTVPISTLQSSGKIDLSTLQPKEKIPTSTIHTKSPSTLTKIKSHSLTKSTTSLQSSPSTLQSVPHLKATAQPFTPRISSPTKTSQPFTPVIIVSTTQKTSQPFTPEILTTQKRKTPLISVIQTNEFLPPKIRNPSQLINLPLPQHSPEDDNDLVEYDEYDEFEKWFDKIGHKLDGCETALYEDWVKNKEELLSRKIVDNTYWESHGKRHISYSSSDSEVMTSNNLGIEKKGKQQNFNEQNTRKEKKKKKRKKKDKRGKREITLYKYKQYTNI